MSGVSDRLARWLFELPTVEVDDLASPLEESERGRLVLDDLNLPPRPEAGLYHDDLGALVRIVRDLRPRRILELGTGRGNATANLCAFSEAEVLTVNALEEQISGKTVTFVLPKDQIGRVYRDLGYEDRVTQVYCDTLKFRPLDHVKPGSVDLAVIDACHDTGYVLSDFYTVLPALSERALVLLHDTHPSRKLHLQKSYDACARLRLQGFDVRHLRETWWGVWWNGAYLWYHKKSLKRRLRARGAGP